MFLKQLSLISFWRSIRADKTVLLSTVCLVVLGLIAQASVAHGSFLQKQLLFALLGIPVFCLGYTLPSSSLKKLCWYLYWFSIILLLWVMIKGTTALGAQRWITIGSFSLQPSEPAKIASIIALALWFQNNRPKNLIDVIRSGCLIVLLPFSLIFLQPDLGTALVLVVIFFSMVFWAGASLSQVLILTSPLFLLISSALGERLFTLATFQLRNHEINIDCSAIGILVITLIVTFLAINYKVWKSKFRSIMLIFYTFLCLLIAMVGRPIAWGLLEPYQQKRLTIFMNPEADPLGAGYNIIQSLMAVGSGGLWGQGYKQGRLTQGQFVPEQHTDFIFSSIAEEWGFAGSAIVVILFALICVRLFFLIKNLEDSFERLVVAGVLAFLTFHTCVNIGMNIGLMPITGVPLPLISYGGTSLWITLLSIGITQRIYKDNSQTPMFNR
ncbi:MAG: rod shape-determining protein RodA [Candidatus Caenarcaniphilales bacterium]|nr:rod shape-determining protein RodA [Candidatus Caenarcaniphilales bacterium]